MIIENQKVDFSEWEFGCGDVFRAGAESCAHVVVDQMCDEGKFNVDQKDGRLFVSFAPFGHYGNDDLCFRVSIVEPLLEDIALGVDHEPIVKALRDAADMIEVKAAAIKAKKAEPKPDWWYL